MTTTLTDDQLNALRVHHQRKGMRMAKEAIQARLVPVQGTVAGDVAQDVKSTVIALIDSLIGTDENMLPWVACDVDADQILP